MTEELRIIVRAEDQASATLKTVSTEIQGLSMQTTAAGTSFVRTGGQATELGQRVTKVHSPLRTLAFLFRAVGLQGPASLLLMAGSATNASIKMGTLSKMTAAAAAKATGHVAALTGQIFGSKAAAAAAMKLAIAMDAEGAAAVLAATKTTGLTLSIYGLELALLPIVIVVGLIIVAMLVLVGVFKLAKASIAEAMDTLPTQITAKFRGALESMSNLWSDFKVTFGQELIGAMTPALESITISVRSILNSIVPLIPGIAGAVGWLLGAVADALQFIAKIARTISQLIYIQKVAFTALGNFIKAFFWSLNEAIRLGINWLVNAAIDGINFLIGQLNKIPGIEIGLIPEWQGLTQAPAPTFESPPTPPSFDSISSVGIPDTVPFQSPGVGGGAGGGGPASAGGAGGLGRSTPAAKAADALELSASREQIQIQLLERVDGHMQELLDLLRNLPQSIRDAIVVYSGSS